MNAMSKKPLPPLLEGWVRELHDPSTNIYIRENYARELQNVVDRINESLRLFSIDRNRAIDNELSKKKRKRV